MTLIEEQLATPLAELARSSTKQPFDAIVVGGGTAGVVSAITLAERGANVALLEAGPLVLLTNVNSTDFRFEPAQATQLRQRVEYAPKYGSGSFGPLIGCLGGRGMFWGGSTPRFEAADVADWPLAHSELAETYAWAESELFVNSEYGDSGLAQALMRALRRESVVVRVLPTALDAGRAADGWLRGTLGNAVTILLRSRMLWRAANPVRLATHALATRLRLDVRSPVAEVLDRVTGTTYELAAKSIVLAAGAFESTRLALVSEAPDRSARLGTGIADHLFSRAYFQIPSTWFDPAKREVALLHFPNDGKRGFQLELHAPAGLLFNASESSRWQPDSTRDYAAMVRSFGVVDPRRESRIEPIAGNGAGLYTVHLDYGAADLERRAAMRREIARVGELLGAPPAQIDDLPPGHSYHEAGGLPMSRTAEDGVTDPCGRFHLFPRLVSADAASWPSLPAANPHLTIAANARRVARRLAEDLAKS